VPADWPRWEHNAEIEEYPAPQGVGWVDPRRYVRLDRSPSFRKSRDAPLLSDGNILIHPFIVAELALGSLRGRTTDACMLDLVPQVRTAQLSEVRRMIEARRLYGLGSV